MKLFIKNTFLFALLLLGIIWVVQIAISHRIEGKTVNGYDTLESTANTNAELVCIGSSRCWAHFDPKFFEENYHLKTINIGMNGHSDLTATVLRLQNYLYRNKAPKFAILNLDPFVNSGSLNNNANFVNKNQYARFAFFPNEKDSAFLDYFKFDNYEKYVPLYALFKYQSFIDCLTLKNTNAFKSGFELNDEKWDTIKYPVNSKAKLYYLKAKEIPNLIDALKKLNSFFQSKNIQLLCIQTPVYMSVYDPKAFEIPKNICQHLRIPFIDTNDQKIITNINNFYNTIHLNKKGVDEMNKLLKNDKELSKFLK